MATSLFYTTIVPFVENGTAYRMKIKIRLNDECKNKVCDFGITADIEERLNSNRWRWCAGGCLHEEILKHAPQFAQFVALHLCDHCGAPMYAIENGSYWFKEKGKEAGKEYLRLTDEEAERLAPAAVDTLYFKYLFHSLGVVARWKQEADAAREELERLTGQTWENPYKPEEERQRLKELTKEEIKTVEERLKSGYYTPEAFAKREEAAKKAAFEKKIQEVLNDYEKATEKARINKEVKLAILNAGLSLENVIYYDHRNEVVFNWMKNYPHQTTEADFERFLNVVDRSELPEGVKFTLKK